MGISYQDYLNDRKEFEPYMEFLEDQTEMETAVRYLMEFPSTEYLGEEFEQAYYQAVREQLKWFRENTTIQETKEEVVTKIKSQRYLQYDNE